MRRTAELAGEPGLRAAYAAHGGEVYRFANRSLGDGMLAEEAVQETFLRAWRAAERFDPELGSLRTWLFAIARNVIIDLSRARAVRPQVTGETGEDPGDNPIEQAMQSWLVEEALGRISGDHRKAIVETYFRGRPYGEVAEELGVPEGTLRSRVFYGLKSLRLTLEEMGWDG